MATISVRSLDANGDVQRGNGQSNFLTDATAVAQITGTKLKLFQGEWWENLNDGTPVFQKLLTTASAQKQQAAALILQQRILSVPYVSGLSNVQFAFNSANRAYGFACTEQTAFGTVAVSMSPGNVATLTT